MSTTEDLYEQVASQLKAERRLAIDHGVLLGLQRALLVVYEARFGPVPDDLAQIMDRTRDADILSRWLSRAATSTATELTALVRGAAAPSRLAR